MRLNLAGLVCGALLVGLVRGQADMEAPNWAFVVGSTTDGTTARGGHYAKCIPEGLFGTNGVTRIYRVGKDQDVLEHTYGWYAPQVYLSGASEKTSVVRMGPWNRGREAGANDLALAFYYDGHLLKSYSTLDIAGRPDNVKASVSHYRWCQQVGGYGWVASPSSGRLIWVFTLETIDGRTLSFDVRTGAIVSSGKPRGGD